MLFVVILFETQFDGLAMDVEWTLSLFCPAIVPHGDDDVSCTINDFFLNSTHEATRFMPCHQREVY